MTAAGQTAGRTTLVLGGARSGKSAFAEGLIEKTGPGTYLATAEVRDEEMRERVRAHQARRGDRWRTVEEPIDIVGVLTGEGGGADGVLIDCLTLWLANLMAREIDPARATEDFLECLAGLTRPIVVVSNEVGMGIVPSTPLGREFRDQAGRMNQAVAAAADRVYFVAAGLPLQLK